jgi:hypothetical protein
MEDLGLLSDKRLRLLVPLLQLVASLRHLALTVFESAFLLEQDVLSFAEPTFLVAQLGARLLDAALFLTHFISFLFGFAVELFTLFEQIFLGLKLGRFQQGFRIFPTLLRQFGHPGSGAVKTHSVEKASASITEEQRNQSGRTAKQGTLPHLHGHSFPWPAALRWSVAWDGCSAAGTSRHALHVSSTRAKHSNQ